jgi:pyrroloquinoline quinone (PQQ) biosynthesis protein C
MIAMDGGPAAADRLVAAALAPGAEPRAAAEAAQALRALGEQAYAGDPGAYARYHGLLYDLHAPGDPATYAVRRFLASTVYPLEELQVEPCEPLPRMTGAALVRRVCDEHERLSGMRHPLSRHLFGGAATLDDLKIYLVHQWHRSRSFYRELTEFALMLPLERTPVIHRNLYEEAGAAPGSPAHPALFRELLAHLALPHGEADRPALPEAQAYLNNRVRCSRHPPPAWGLAVLFALEVGTPATHGALYDLLLRLGVPEEVCAFHRVHITADARHAEELLALVAELVDTPEAQAIFFRSLRHHKKLHRAYFDRIWEEVRGAHGKG